MLNIRKIKTDVLVVGGGIAGSRAAVEAARHGVDVTLVTKGVYGSGTSVGPVVCAAVGDWAPEDDSKDLHFEGIVVTGRRFLLDQELARVLVDEAPDRLVEMETDFGHLWDRNEDGKVEPYFEFSEEVRLKEEDHRYHKNRYISCTREGMYNGYTGMNVLLRLKEEVRRLGVRILEESMAFELLVEKGVVQGALALDYLHGELLVIEAKATVIASGSISQLWYPWGLAGREMTGDGLAMALRGGAVLSDIELIMTAYLPSVTPAWSGRHKLLQSVIECAPDYRPEYRIGWINASGEEFMRHYMTEVPDAYEDFYLTVIRAVQTELDEGRGPLYMDYSRMPKAFMDRIAAFLGRYMDKLDRKEGQYKLEVGPNPMWSFGGIKINTKCEASAPGLYACGDASNATKDGFGASVACGVTTCLVFGKRAGEAAAERAAQTDMPDVAEQPAVDKQAYIQGLFKRKNGIAPLTVKTKIGDIMRKYMHLKNEKGMQTALDGVRDIRNRDLPNLKIHSSSKRYNYEIIEAIEVRNMLDVAEIFILASLMRKESRRHLFLREDYPRRDDKNWLKHITIQKCDNELLFKTIPVQFPYVQPDETGLRAERSIA